VECATPATATATFGRRPDEVPTARRFIREALDGHPSSFDAELLTCELVTNVVQHATDAGWVTVTVMRRCLVRARAGGLTSPGRSGRRGDKGQDRSGYRGRDLGRR
jgi:hypothetical protein